MFDLSGRVVVVTGGNGGIGLGMAAAVAEAGADVAIWGRNADKNARASDELVNAYGRRVESWACDVSDEEQVVTCFADTVDRLGKVDCLIANAGIGGFSPFPEMPLSEWRRVMSVNLDGAEDSMVVQALHTFIAADPRVVAAVIRYLDTGRLLAPTAG